MKRNLTLSLYFLIVLFMVACGKQTVNLPIETSIPVVISPTSIPATVVPTSTFIPLIITPSPLPTELVFAIITPDPIQVQRWNEYEDALARAFFSDYFRPEEVVCEWEILGRADQEVYVSAHCASTYSAGPSQGWIPAVIHIGINGAVQSAEIPGAGTAYGADIRRLFPTDVQERIFSHSMNFQSMDDRIRWRRGHPDEPPLIVLPFSKIPPTQPVIPWMTPDPIQVERWKEYQTALAGALDYRPPEEVICEWEFLGRVDSEVSVWAVCGAIRDNRVGLEGLVRLDVVDGNVLGSLLSDDPKRYPSYVMERYFSGLIHFQELVDHLRWRQAHPEEPPLVVLNATSMP